MIDEILFRPKSMPVIDPSQVAVRDAEDSKILNLVVKKDGSIRASKPKVKDSDPITGKSAYVWCMVCFQVSPKGVHHCMPVCANFDLPAFNEAGKWSSAIAREMEKSLTPLIDAIVNCVPKSKWYGVNRWGKALGYL
jgi:hypothetical protein